MDKKHLDEFAKLEKALKAVNEKMTTLQKQMDSYIANGRDALQRDIAKHRPPKRGAIP